jgi:hypothetical protein
VPSVYALAVTGRSVRVMASKMIKNVGDGKAQEMNTLANFRIVDGLDLALVALQSTHGVLNAAGGHMRFAALALLLVLSSVFGMAQDSPDGVTKELEAVHAKWFKAFDGGDGATMDQIELANISLVMPDGYIVKKNAPRVGTQPKIGSQMERTLSDVSVRQMGRMAILTGILTSKSSKETTNEATTVVFVQTSGAWKIASAQWTTVAKAK